MPTIGHALSRLEAELFVGREPELLRFRQWLEAEMPVPTILNVSGPGGVGKSGLLRAFQRTALGLGRPAVLADSEYFPGTPESLLKALGGDGAEDVLRSLNATCPLLLLDTFESHSELTRYLLEEFLPRLETGVKVVIAGRYPLALAWSTGETWHQLISPLPLAPLAPSECRMYLGRRGLTEPGLVEQVLLAASGLPLALSLAADLALQLGIRDFTAAPEWHLVVRSLVERFVRDLPNPELRELLEAGAVVRQFDEALLAAISGRDEIGDGFDQLCRLSVVRPTEHGLMLHDEVRRLLADDLRWRHAERYSALRLRALAAYRDRMRAAPPAEHERLLMDRLSLWEQGFIQKALFHEDEPGQVWVEPGRPGDHAAILQAEWVFQHQVVPATLCPVEWPPEYDEAAHFALIERLLGHPALRLRVARDRRARLVGFDMVLPLYKESVEFLLGHPILGAVLRAYYNPAALAGLPSTPDGTDTFYLIDSKFVEVGPEPVSPEITNAALLRDFFSVFARGCLYFCSAALPVHRALLDAFGFEPVPGALARSWFQGHPFQGYVLDLRRIGVETWIEALIGGRPVPRALRPDEVEPALHDALLHWHDDTALARSPLADTVARDAGETGAPRSSEPQVVRESILRVLAQARARATPEQELAYRALELAYVETGISHEQAAERLAVSRTTFYRMLKRGVRGLARAFDARPP